MPRLLLPCVFLTVWLAQLEIAALHAAKPSAGFVEFSHPRGVVSEGFQLKLSSPKDRTIYYTLDGSLPTKAAGLRYSKPLTIDKTIVVRATTSASTPDSYAVNTHTYLFANQVWKQLAYPEKYVRSAISQRHGPSRPQEFDWAMDPELLTNEKERSELLEALNDLPSLAVTISIDDLNFLYKHHRSRGSAFERTASLELIYPKTAPYESFAGFQIDCGIRMQGGMAVDQARKKSFRVLFKKKYGEGKLEYPVFESAAHHAASAARRFDTLVLRSGGNVNWSKDIAWKHEPGMYLRDSLVRDSQIAMSGFGSRSTFVHLFFNGLYFGVFNIAERPECKFMASYSGGDPEDYYSINHNGTVDGNSTRWDQAQRTNQLHKHVDIESFCDYIILNWATGMGDWPWNNYYAGGRNNPPGPIYFFAWDAEHAFWTNPGYLYSNPGGWVNPLFLDRATNGFRGSTPIVDIWKALAKDAEFKVVFADRVHRHLFGHGELSDAKLLADFNGSFPKLIRQWSQSHVAGEMPLGVREDKPHTRDYDFRGNCQKVADLIEGNSSRFLQSLQRHNLYPQVSAPELTDPTKTDFVTSHLVLDFHPPQKESQQVYYTLDGSDPRLTGGDLNPKAFQWTKSESVAISHSMRVRARTRDGQTWSALLDRTFLTHQHGVPLRFTEIMYHPSHENDAESLEFIELQNTGDSILDVTGFHLEGVEYRFPPGSKIRPKQVFILMPNDAPDRFRAQYPNVNVYGSYRQHLSNDGEHLAIIDRQGQTVTELKYEVSGKWPAEARGSGKSIHCHNLDDPANSASWRSGTITPGTVTPTKK